VNGPSLTARRVAERRAAHQILDSPVVLVDPVALPIVGATTGEAQAALLAREQSRVARALRAFMAARSRVAEDEVAREAARGLSQYVLLGAGLDTFACRNPFAERLRVFEVDRQSTQQWKRERLAAADLAVAPSTVFVTVDFERDDLFASLRDAGWDSAKPTLFAWLGVTMYLDAATVLALLRSVGSLVTGTGIVFDYGVAPHLLGPLERQVYDEFARRVQAAGEPWISGFEPGALAQELHACGFTRVDDFGAAELNDRYFRDRSDGLRVGTLARVVCARR
jgi:methyltransferase (TIGR00027 family)